MYHILLVDDEPRTTDALVKNVNWEACNIDQIYRATNMEAAIHTIEKEEIHAMVCDIEMPNGTGLELLEKLRDSGCNIPCIFATCHPEFDYMRKAIQLNSQDYILKPIIYEEFEQVLKAIIDKLESNVSSSEEEKIELPSELQVKERNVEQEVKMYVKEHLAEDITVTQIADVLHFNPQYLMRTFKAKSGVSIMEYITQTRLAYAKKILRETDLPIKSVALMVGYADYAYFTRVFRKETGYSPSQYRNAR